MLIVLLLMGAGTVFAVAAASAGQRSQLAQSPGPIRYTPAAVPKPGTRPPSAAAMSAKPPGAAGPTQPPDGTGSSAPTKPPAIQPPPTDDVPKPGRVSVRTVTLTYPTRNVRPQPTAAGNQPLRQVHAGDRVPTVALLTGQDPYGDGRNLWLRLTDGNFMWADSTNAVTVYGGRPEAARPASAMLTPDPGSAPTTTASKSAAGATPVLAMAPAVRPLDHYRITGRFGETGGAWGSHPHPGVDLAAPSGTPVHAAVAATVKVNPLGPNSGYGIHVVEYLADGSWLIYGHLERANVSSGATVAAGQVIGYVGETGYATGPHLHFEYRPRGGPPADPVLWLQQEGVILIGNA